MLYNAFRTSAENSVQGFAQPTWADLTTYPAFEALERAWRDVASEVVELEEQYHQDRVAAALT